MGKATLKIDIIQSSLLALHLKDVYESFAYRETKKIKINNWQQLTIQQFPKFNNNMLINDANSSSNSSNSSDSNDDAAQHSKQ